MSDLSRRFVLGAGAALAGAGAARAQPTPAQPLRVRRNVVDPAAANDLKALGYAIGVMRASSGPLSWQQQVDIHAGDWGQHMSWRFLPWHRAQLNWFERIVASISRYPSFAMPYWDWQQTPVLPAIFLNPQSPFFHANRRPDIARVDFNQARATDGRFPNWASVAADDFYVFAGYSDAGGSVETSGHGFVHMTILGDMGDPGTAPRDPAFFFHHCNIDRVWDTWQAGAEQRAIDSDPDWLAERFDNFIDERGQPASALTTAQVIHPSGLGYRYDAAYPYPWFDEQPMRPPAGTTRRELVEARPVRVSLTNTPGAAGVLRAPLPPDVAALLASDTTGQTLELKGKGRVRLSGPGISGSAVKLSVRRFGGSAAQNTLMAGAVAFGGNHHMALAAAAPAAAGHAPSAPAHGDAPPSHGLAFAIGPQLYDATGIDEPVDAEVEVEAAVTPMAPAVAGSPPAAAPLITGLELELVINRYRWV